ncbi:MAG TPA: sulfatase, partial [Verrucomicrobiales bacterium]|nr:sulfatase [Verrucomicrobiales bacterium]
QRGMLHDTLVVWAGEFGRTPMSQGGDGRDHHNAGFSIWMAGGGVKAGTVFGATDELGYSAVDNPIDVHDLHATMLKLLGIEHTRMTVKFQGLDARLTGVAGRVIDGLLA